MPVVGAIQYPIFMPALRQITAITNALPALVTTSFDHGYITGSIVRLYVPYGYGMQQVNFIKAPIVVINATQFTIAIDTTLFDPFVVPMYDPNYIPTPAQSVPVGEQTDTLLSAFQNILMPLF